MAAPRLDPLASVTPECRELYSNLLTAVARIGSFREEKKKTSIHLARNSAFLGVHPRQRHLNLTVKASAPARSTRVFKAGQVSANRWHWEIKLTASGEIDRELLAWIRDAYALCG